MTSTHQRRHWTAARAAITKALEAAGPQGMLVNELADAINLSRPTVETVAPLMAREQQAQVLPDPCGRAINRKRYFAIGVDPVVVPQPRKERPPAKPKAPRVKAETKPRAQKALTVVGSKPPKRATFSASAEVTKAPGFRFVRCPGFERVTDAKVKAEPYFGAMPVGTYVATGSAIERALESRA